MSEYEDTVRALHAVAVHMDCFYCPADGKIDCCPWMQKYHKCLFTFAAEAIHDLIKSVHIRDKHLDELNHYIQKLEAAQPHWVSVEERKPPEYTDVWCAVYTTDLIYVEDGETVEEAIENRHREAARNPRVTLGSYSEDEGWTDGYFGMPMVCRPDYWLEMTIPEPPQDGRGET